MMTQKDYEAVALALRTSLPATGTRVRVYRRMVPLLAARNPKFDADKFGKSMGLPRLFCEVSNSNNQH